MQRVKKKVIAYLVAIAMLLSLMPQVSMTANAAAENSLYKGTVSNITKLVATGDNSNLPTSSISGWPAAVDESDTSIPINNIDVPDGFDADEYEEICVIVGVYTENEETYYQCVLFYDFGEYECITTLKARTFNDTDDNNYVGTYTPPSQTAQSENQILDSATKITSLNESLTLSDGDAFTPWEGSIGYGKAYKITVDSYEILGASLSTSDEYADVFVQLYTATEESGETTYEAVDPDEYSYDGKIVHQNGSSSCEYYLLFWTDRIGEYNAKVSISAPPKTFKNLLLDAEEVTGSMTESVSLSGDFAVIYDNGDFRHAKAYKLTVDDDIFVFAKISTGNNCEARITLYKGDFFSGIYSVDESEGNYYSGYSVNGRWNEAVTISEAGDYYLVIHGNAAWDEGTETLDIKYATYKKATTISGAGTFTKTYGDKAFSLGAKANSGAKLSYSSSNTNVATVSSSGVVTPKNPGTAKITIKAPSTDSYKAATKTVTVKVNKANQQITNAVSAKTIKYSALKKKTQTFAMGAKAKGKVTYKKVSGNKKITVSGSGKVSVKKGLKKGTYKLKVKVSAASTKYYNAKSITKTIKIKVK